MYIEKSIEGSDDKYKVFNMDKFFSCEDYLKMPTNQICRMLLTRIDLTTEKSYCNIKLKYGHS